MPSPEATAFLDMVRTFREGAVGEPDATLTVEQQRAGADAAMSAVGVMPEGVTVTETEVAGGIPALWIHPDGAATDRVLLYFHGGGYVVNSMHTHVKLTSAIAKAAGCRALSIDYRMAPEHPHPAAVTDALATYRWLLSEGFEPGHIAISGDSAGGGLTIATLVAARSAALPQPAAAATMSPWVDLEGTGESMDTNASVDLMVDRFALRVMADQFIAGGDIRDPLAAPLYADLTGIAPLYIQVGGHETLLDDSTRLATRAAHAGVDVRLEVFPEMQHVFQSGVGMLPESNDAVARIGAYLNHKLGIG